MTNRTAATRYARALLDVAVKENADLDQVERELVSITDLFKEHKALAHALLNPVVPVPRKRAAIEALTTAGHALPMVAKLLGFATIGNACPAVVNASIAARLRGTGTTGLSSACASALCSLKRSVIDTSSRST